MAIINVNPCNPVSEFAVLDRTEAKEDGYGSDNWSYTTYKAPLKSSPTYQHPAF